LFGVPPLGYRAQDGKLVVIESEAEIVREVPSGMWLELTMA